MQGEPPKMGPRRITIVPAPPPEEIPSLKPKLPVQTTSVPERPKSRVATKVPSTVSSHPGSRIPPRPPSVAESSKKNLGDPKAGSIRPRSQTMMTKPNRTEKTKEVQPQSRARTTSNARPPSRMDLFKPTRPPSRADPNKSKRTGAATTTKTTDTKKRPDPQLAHSKGSKETELAISVPLPPSPTLLLPSNTDSLPSLKLETEVEFVPPVTASPRKATAETKVVHALKTGLPLLCSPPHSPSPIAEALPAHVLTPEPAEELVEPATEPAQEGPVQKLPAQVVEQGDPVPEPVLSSKQQPVEPLPALVHPVPEPPTLPEVRGNEGKKKVGDLVAHFEDTNRRKPPRPPRMVEQTPISALVSTIRKGFEEMKPLPALETVEEGDSVDLMPPPRPTGGLKVGHIKGLNIRSKPGFGERTVLTAMRLNN